MSSFFAVLFKVIPYLMPFIKEMLIGKKTWKQAFRENRGKTILTVAIAISVVFNVVLVTKVGTMAVNYLELSRAKEELEKKVLMLEKGLAPLKSSPKHPIANETEVVAEIPKPKKSSKEPKDLSAERLRAIEMKAHVERIRQREALDH